MRSGMYEVKKLLGLLKSQASTFSSAELEVFLIRSPLEQLSADGSDHLDGT